MRSESSFTLKMKQELPCCNRAILSEKERGSLGAKSEPQFAFHALAASVSPLTLYVRDKVHPNEL